jgi:hypothetical protein
MRLRLVTAFVAAVVATIVIDTATVRGSSPETCAPDATPDKYRLLRQLTLDLWGRIPTYDEYQAVAAIAELDAAAIDQMFTSDEYFAEMRSYFRHLIWGGLPDDMNVIGTQRVLTRVATSNLYFSGNLRTLFRGRNDVVCLDQPQTDFDAGGRPLPISTFADTTCTGGTCRQEGYVMVTPYWSTTALKVCAFDAQALATGVGTTPPTCGPYTINLGCGCGPNLRNCTLGAGDPSTVALRDGLADEAPRIFEAVVRGDRSYFETFTTTQSSVNGPLAHFYGNLSGPGVALRQAGTIGYDGRIASLPTLPFADRSWMPVERDAAHAGVLTTAGFLLRFGSNRGRVNRFYTAFRCEPFSPTAGGLPPDIGGEPEPNLRVRNGCATCHEVIERAAAHWGRWRTNSQFGYLSAADVDFTGVRAECRPTTGASRSFCDSYFVTRNNTTHADELLTWEGWPQPRQWLSPTEAEAIDRGPSGLVDEPAEQAKVAECAVRTLAQQLLGRELTEDESLRWLPQATTEFAAAGYRMTGLYRRLVDLPQYRMSR